MCISASAHAPRIMGCGKSRLRSPNPSDVDLKKSNSNTSSGHNNSGGKNGKKSSRNGGGKCNSGKGGIGGNNKVGGGVIQQQAGGSDNTGTTGSSGTKTSPSKHAQSGKKKKNVLSGGSVTSSSSESERKSGDREKEAAVEGKPPSSSKKSLPNGKSARPRERNDEIGVSPTRQPKPSSAAGTGSGPAGDANDRQNGGNSRAHSRPYLLEVPNEIPSSNSPQSKTTARDFKSLTASKIVHVTKSQIEFFRMLDEKIEKGADYVTSANTSEVSSLCEVEHH